MRPLRGAGVVKRFSLLEVLKKLRGQKLRKGVKAT